MSFNRITKIEGLNNLLNLKKLFLCSNKISKIEHLNHLVNLTLLELGDNKIRVSPSFDGFFLYLAVIFRKLIIWRVYHR